jgi:hypothetical protein
VARRTSDLEHLGVLPSLLFLELEETLLALRGARGRGLGGGVEHGLVAAMIFVSFFVYSGCSSTCSSRCLGFHIFFALRMDSGCDILLRAKRA